MRQLDELYMKYPFYGCRRMAITLGIDKDYANRLMRKMGIEAIYPKPHLSKRVSDHKIYPYLLRGVKIERPNQVWSTDITYIPLRNGFAYLTAVIDWYSRYVLSWEISNSLETGFCVSVTKKALESYGIPEIFNTDQGSQYTSQEFTSPLLLKGIRISMDGRGRAFDNIFIERLWRSVKYEEIYLHSYTTLWELETRLAKYFEYYNKIRPHQHLSYRPPQAIYYEEKHLR